MEEQQFLDFMLSKVKNGKQDIARNILSPLLEKHKSGSLTKGDVDAIVPKMLEILRIETIPEVGKVFGDFREKLPG